MVKQRREQEDDSDYTPTNSEVRFAYAARLNDSTLDAPLSSFRGVDSKGEAS